MTKLFGQNYQSIIFEHFYKHFGGPLKNAKHMCAALNLFFSLHFDKLLTYITLILY